MSGHSKWNNIKRTKGKADAVRGKIFTKIGREIVVAVKSGGADPIMNPKLRDIITKAKQNNMPNDTIDRSIKKASGELAGVDYTAIQYEGYGIGGSAVIVQALTDNKNRTAGDVRHLFDKFAGALGTNGCVSYLFEEKGIIVIEKLPSVNEDDLMLASLDAGALDVVSEEDVFEIYTKPTELSAVKTILEQNGYVVVQSEVSFIPQNEVKLDSEQEQTFVKMIEKLEDLDDVQDVYHNVILSENALDDNE